MKHTETPWRIDECNGKGIFNLSYLITADDPIEPEERIVICRLPTGQGKFSQQYHNATFIVQAVNAHEKLVEALKAIESERTAGRTINFELLKQARAALALVEGGEK